MHSYAVFYTCLDVACSAGVFFRRANVFASESAMLKPPEEKRKWGESKGAGTGLPSFALAPTLRATISTLPNRPLS